MNLIMETIILMSLPGRIFSSPQKAEKNSATAAIVNLGGYGGAKTFSAGAAAEFGGSAV